MNTKKIYGSAEMEHEFGHLSFGQALWAHRKSEEISQKDFAKYLGISQSSLCDIEKGRKIPSPSRAAKIAGLIGMPQKSWVCLALQDMLRQAELKYTVSVA